ncbi:MAG: GlsB/YeaQ/YmgE family stress response membrane protein [Ignavibacteria bacterium]|nr:GlsB/YeaQ/YmgE family stress response membrane protein [Ignavibacteria bacterium]
MSLIWSAIIGLIAGALAKLVMPGKDPGGIFVTMLIGIVGALLFTFLGRMIGWYDEGESAGFIAAFFGAIVLLLIYRMIKGKSAARAVKD